MEFSTHTYKIELRFDTDDKEQMEQYSQQLRDIRYNCMIAARRAFCHMYVLMDRGSFHYHTVLRKTKELGLDIKSKEVQDKIKQEVAKLETEEFIKNPKTGKPIATSTGIYQMLSAEFLEVVPAATLSSLTQKIVSTFTKQKKGYLNHQRELPVFKKTMPIPFTAVSIRNIHPTTITVYNKRPVKNPEPGGPTHEFVPKQADTYGFNLYKIPFKINFGRDRSGNYERFQKAISYHLLPEWVRDAEGVLSDAISSELEKKRKNDFIYTHEENQLQFTFKNEPYPGKKSKDDERDFFYEVETGRHKFIMKPAILKSKFVWKIASDYKIGDSEISMDKKEFRGNDGKLKYKTKLFLHLVIQAPKNDDKLRDDLSATASLGVDFPIKINFLGETHTIGSYDQLRRKRSNIRAAFRRKQSTPTIGVSGHGTRKRLEVLSEFNNAEANYADHMAHIFSKKLVDFVKDNKIKHLHLNPPEPFPPDMPVEQKRELIRTYGWAGLIEKITYKCADQGINLTTAKDLEKQ